MIADSHNNFYGMNLNGQYIIRVDAKTMNVTPYPTPTPNSGPRRGHMDPQDRLWFAEYRGNRIAMLDTKSERIQEWAIPTPWTNPYDAVLDKEGNAWTGGMTNDRIVRLNTKTGEFTEYLLPRTTNVRRVNVDDSTNRLTSVDGGAGAFQNLYAVNFRWRNRNIAGKMAGIRIVQANIIQHYQHLLKSSSAQYNIAL